MKIYTYFGQYFFLENCIIGQLQRYFIAKPERILNIITLKEHGKLLEKVFPNNVNIIIPHEENKLMMTYQKYHHGAINSGNPDNVKIITKYGLTAIDSELMRNNAWFELNTTMKEWLKENNLPKEGYNLYGDKIGTEYKEAPKGTFSYIEHLAKKYKDLPWFPRDDEEHNPKENIYDLFIDILKPFFSYSDKRGQFIRAEE